MTLKRLPVSNQRHGPPLLFDFFKQCGTSPFRKRQTTREGLWREKTGGLDFFKNKK